MKLLCMRFELFTLNLKDDRWIDVCRFEYCFQSGQELDGALFYIGKMYEGRWEWDFLYFQLFYTLWWNWKENHYIQRDRK